MRLSFTYMYSNHKHQRFMWLSKFHLPMHPMKVSPEAALIDRQNQVTSENLNWISPQKIPNPLACLGILTYTVHPNKHSWNQFVAGPHKAGKTKPENNSRSTIKVKSGEKLSVAFLFGENKWGNKKLKWISYISRWWFFTNPFEKYAQVKMGSSSPGIGVKTKKNETTTPSCGIISFHENISSPEASAVWYIMIYV